MKRTKKLALCGVFCALAVVLMFLSALLSMFNIALPIFAGVILMPLMVELGWKWSLCAYAAVSLLSVLLARNTDSLILFIGMFGWYPIVKGCLEKRRMKRPLEVFFKLLCLNAALALCCLTVAFFLGLTEMAQQILSIPWGIALFWAAMNLLFVLYDFCLSRTAAWYVGSIRKKILK